MCGKSLVIDSEQVYIPTIHPTPPPPPFPLPTFGRYDIPSSIKKNKTLRDSFFLCITVLFFKIFLINGIYE